MKKILLYALMIAGIGCLASCKSGGKPSADAGTNKEASPAPAEAQFPFPDIPTVLTEPDERKDFLITHYWDNFNFSDTTLLQNRNITEQGFVNHISLLADGQTPEDKIEESIGNLCTHMEKQEPARKVFMQLFDDYLYNPNSPLYNEPLYIIYLKRMLQSPALDEARKSSLDFKLKLASRNLPGAKASDFTYYLPNGQARTLQETNVKNNRLLLVFYDPECPGCHEIMQEMIHDTALAAAVGTGQLTVLAIYTEGNPEAWENDLSSIPSGWLAGTDREAIKLGALYDLKAMPSLYLLDGEKRVLLKDAPYSRIRTELGL